MANLRNTKLIYNGIEFNFKIWMIYMVWGLLLITLQVILDIWKVFRERLETLFCFLFWECVYI